MGGGQRSWEVGRGAPDWIGCLYGPPSRALPAQVEAGEVAAPEATVATLRKWLRHAEKEVAKGGHEWTRTEEGDAWAGPGGEVRGVLVHAGGETDEEGEEGEEGEEAEEEAAGAAAASAEEAAAAAAKTPREPLPTCSSDEAGEAARRWEAAVGAAKAARADADSDEQAQAAAAKRKACDVAPAEGNEERPAKLSREVLV